MQCGFRPLRWKDRGSHLECCEMIRLYALLLDRDFRCHFRERNRSDCNRRSQECSLGRRLRRCLQLRSRERRAADATIPLNLRHGLTIRGTCQLPFFRQLTGANRADLLHAVPLSLGSFDVLLTATMATFDSRPLSSSRPRTRCACFLALSCVRNLLTRTAGPGDSMNSTR